MPLQDTDPTPSFGGFGLNRRQVAGALFIAEGTVRSHLEHIYGKIGVSSRATATLFAVEHNLLP